MGAVWTRLTERREKDQAAFYRAYNVNERLMHKLQSVGIGKRQLFELHQTFSAMDRDGSGEINLGEFFNYIDIKRTRFSEKAFAVMDRDGSGEIDFIEFVLAVWNYCSFSHVSLVRYAFDLYDLDGSGEIELDEAGRCVREIWGSEWERSANAQKVLTKLEGVMQGTANGRLTVQKFQEFAQRHPILLFPAFQLQTEIQHRVLGERFWRKAARLRAKVNPLDLDWGNLRSMVSFSRQASRKLLQNVDEELLEKHMERQLSRKQSSIGQLIAKVRPKKHKVFLDSDDDDDGRVKKKSVPALASSEDATTVVSAFDATEIATPSAAKRKSRRPPAVDTSSTTSLASDTSLASPSPSPKRGKKTKARGSNSSSPMKFEGGQVVPAADSFAPADKERDLVVEDFDSFKRGG